MKRKIVALFIAGMLAWLSTSCIAPKPRPDDQTISATMKDALSKIPGVTGVIARYTVIVGMGSTMFVAIDLESARDSDAKKALAEAARITVETTQTARPTTNVNMGCNYGGPAEKFMDLTVFGLERKPMLSDLRTYVRKPPNEPESKHREIQSSH